MITPMNAPITLRRNDKPWRATFVVENEDGSIKDMSALTARMHIRLLPGSTGDPLIELLSSDSSGTYIDMSAAGAEAIIANADILTLPVDGARAGEAVTYHYDLLVTEDGDENAWFYGTVTLERGVTV